MEIKKQEKLITKFLQRARAKKMFDIFQKEYFNIFYAFFAEFLVIFILLFVLQQNNFQTNFSFGLLKLLFIVILISSFVYGSLKAIINKPSLAKIAFQIDQEAGLPDLISSAYFFTLEPKKTDSMKFVIQTCCKYMDNDYKKEDHLLLKSGRNLFLFSCTIILLLLLISYFPTTKYGKFSKNVQTDVENWNKQKKNLSPNFLTANSQNSDIPKINQPRYHKKVDYKQQKDLPQKRKKETQQKNKKNPIKNQQSRKNIKQPNGQGNKSKRQKGKNRKRRPKKYIPYKISPLFSQGENWILNKKLNLSGPGAENKIKQNVLNHQLHNKFRYQAEKYLQNSTISALHRKAIKNYFRLIQP